LSRRPTGSRAYPNSSRRTSRPSLAETWAASANRRIWRASAGLTSGCLPSVNASTNSPVQAVNPAAQSDSSVW